MTPLMASFFRELVTAIKRPIAGSLEDTIIHALHAGPASILTGVSTAGSYSSAALCKYTDHEYITKPSEAYLCNSTEKAFLGIDYSDL
jgi:hypothetical protein